MNRRIVMATIILALLIVPFVIIQERAQAQTSFIGCAADGFISNWINGLIGGLLGGLVGSEVPVKEGQLRDKELVRDLLTRCAATEVLRAMGRDVNNIARTAGRDGGVTWIRNWRNFQLDAQYRGEEIFRSMLASTNTCDYFEADLKSAFGVRGQLDLGGTQTRAGDFDSFQLRAGCTMPSGWSMTAYQNDFADQGGWDAWSRLLEPQNNFYGAFFQSLAEADKQRALEQETDINQTIANRGLLGVSGRSAEESCLVRGANGRCVVYRDIQTPGSVLFAGVQAGIQSEFDYVVSAREMGELITLATEILINRLLNFADSNEGDYLIPGPLPSYSPLPEPPPSTGGDSIPPGFAPNVLGDIQNMANSSSEWSQCQAGNGVACHRFVQEVVQTLNPSCGSGGWGLLSKSPGEWQCTTSTCGNLGGEGYGEDIIVWGPTETAVDIIVGAGAPGAYLAWQPTDRRPSNRWICPFGGGGGGGNGGEGFEQS